MAACVDLLRQAHDHDRYPPFGWPEDPVAFLAPPAETQAWVATDECRVVGHVALHEGAEDPAALALATSSRALRRSDVAVVARLVVARSARRTGVGRRLLERACDAARAGGLEPALDVAKYLDGTVRFYEALGWMRVGELTIEGGGRPVDAWVYTAPPSRLTRTALIAAGPDGTIAVANEGVTALFGYARGALIGQRIDVLVPDRYRSRHAAGWRRAWVTGMVRPSRTSLIPVVCADGAVRAFAGRLSPVTDPHGEVMAIAATWSAPTPADAGLPRLR